MKREMMMMIDRPFDSFDSKSDDGAVENEAKVFMNNLACSRENGQRQLVKECFDLFTIH